jgi:hypothetical protein
VSTSTIRSSPTAAGTRADRGSYAPFAALPHDIAADPRLSPTDVRVLLALLFWARSKADCWPSDRSIGLRVGRSVRTVQRVLGRLESLGLVGRSPDPGNPTGRRIVLRHRCHTPTTPTAEPPASPMADELRRERERERPESAAGCESPPPPAGDGGTEPDLATLHQWAEGADPILRRIAERRLAELAAEAGAVVEPVAAVEPIAPPPAPVPAPPVVPGSTASATVLKPPGSPGPATSRPSSPGVPKPGSAPAGPQGRGTRRGSGPAVPTTMVTVLATWLARRAP